MLKQPVIQAALGILILFALMGTLYMRGKANNTRRNKERREHAESVLKARISRQNSTPQNIRAEFGLNRHVPPPPPGFECFGDRLTQRVNTSRQKYRGYGEGVIF